VKRESEGRTIKLLAISDIHEDFEAFAPETLPEADLCVIAGDLTNYGLRGNWRLSRANLRILQAWAKAADLSAWQGQEIARAKAWLEAMSRRYPVFWIPGNHDIGIENETFGVIPNCEGILNRTVEFNGLRLYGVSMSPCYDLPALAEQWDYMTADPEEERAAYDFPPVDIVVSHCPPYGCLDSGVGLGARIPPLGSLCLREYIERNAPRLVLCGHIHEAAGHARLGPTDIFNVAGTWRLIEL